MEYRPLQKPEEADGMLVMGKQQVKFFAVDGNQVEPTDI